VHEGNFKQSTKKCITTQKNCKSYEEKQTDVAIAVKLVSDALADSYDRAILVTADSDQIPTARFLSILPDKDLTLLYPPGRQTHARELGDGHR
jgi:uncharacterized LabA/DUF88 family protein